VAAGGADSPPRTPDPDRRNPDFIFLGKNIVGTDLYSLSTGAREGYPKRYFSNRTDFLEALALPGEKPRAIALTQERYGSTHSLVWVNLDSETQYSLLQSEHLLGELAISPDLAWAAMVDRRSAASPGTILLVPTQGGDPIPLSASTPHQDSSPSFSSDGTRLGFVRSVGSTSQILIVPVQNGGAGSPEILARGGDGEIFSHFRFGSRADQSLYLSVAPTSSELRILQDGKTISLQAEAGSSFAEASWSPDGQQVAYSIRSREGPSLWVYPLPGGPARKIADLRADKKLCPSWSGDGQQLFFADERSGQGQLFRADIASGTIETITAFSSWVSYFCPSVAQAGAP
jgi:Tol biopolymer transport system component